MTLDTPYYAVGGVGTTAFFASAAEAISAACAMKLAPFVVYQLIPHAVTQRLSNVEKVNLNPHQSEAEDGA